MAHTRDGARIGILAGLVSSLCCLPAVIIVPVFILLGMQSFGFAFALTKYQPHFIALGLLFAALSYLSLVKKREGSCSIKGLARCKKILAAALVTQFIFLALVYYIILPQVAGAAYARLTPPATTTVPTTLPATTIIPSTTSVEATTSSTLPAETCLDGALTQDEENVDCGGACEPCGTVGIEITGVAECNNLEYNDVFFTLHDYGVNARNWGSKDARKNFKVFCDGERVMSYRRLDKVWGDTYLGVSNLFAKSIPGDYRFRVGCRRTSFNDLMDCEIVKIELSMKSDSGFGVINLSSAAEAVASTPSTLTSTSIVSTTSLPAEPGQAVVVLRLATYCPSCVPAAKYLLATQRGVVSVSNFDSENKLWRVTYNPKETGVEKIRSGVAEFDPEVVE